MTVTDEMVDAAADAYRKNKRFNERIEIAMRAALEAALAKSQAAACIEDLAAALRGTCNLELELNGELPTVRIRARATLERWGLEK